VFILLAHICILRMALVKELPPLHDQTCSARDRGRFLRSWTNSRQYLTLLSPVASIRKSLGHTLLPHPTSPALLTFPIPRQRAFVCGACAGTTQVGICIRVVPSEIQNLERKRGQHQDSWVFRGLSKRNTTLQDLDMCGIFSLGLWHFWLFYVFVGLGLWHFWLFYVLCDILGFAIYTAAHLPGRGACIAQKKPKKLVPCDKNLEFFDVQKCDTVTFWNVTKYHTLLNAWYKATFTSYVWISLRTPLTLKFILQRVLSAFFHCMFAVMPVT